MKPTPPFTGGKESVRTKLNELVASKNSFGSVRGDLFIRVVHTSMGLTIGLNIEEVLSRIPKIAGTGGGVTLPCGLIVSKEGSLPPYIYTAEAALMDVDGNWEAVSSDGPTYENVFNINEQGMGGQWVNPLQVGDPVILLAAPGGANAWLCWRDHYRGTF